jgi:hypothetical protein
LKYSLGLLASAFLVAASVLAQPPVRPASGTVIGSVKKVDAAGRKLTVAPLGRGAERVVSIPASVVVTRTARAKATELKVGDTISVSGQPLVLNASQVRIGDAPPTVERPQPNPANRAPSPTRGNAGRAPGGGGPRYFGKVVRVSPLVVALTNGPTFEVRTSRNTRFTKAVRIGIGQVKAGEPVTAFGTPQADGSVVARRVQVGFDAMPFVRPR